MAVENLSHPTRPEAATLRVLRGKFSEPINTFFPDGIYRTIRIVRSGSGMLGLKEHYDSRDWAGIFRHCMFTARVATFLSEKFKEAGYPVNPGTVTQAHIVSHPKRRVWDEARWYPQYVKNAGIIAETPNEILGFTYLVEKEMPEDVVTVVAALAHGFKGDPAIYNSWEYRLSS